jgi:hypothetical protein
MANLHLIKLCVGTECVEDLAEWQAQRMAERRAAEATPAPSRHPDVAQARGGAPRRRVALWVIKGFVLARQRIRALEPREGADGVRRCALLLEPEILRTSPQPRRPFQGWRYLPAAEAPRDLAGGAGPRGPAPRADGPARRDGRPVSAPRAAALVAALAVSASAAAAQRFDWDALGAEFCARSVSGDLASLRPLITASLAQEIEFAFARAGAPVPRTFFPELLGRRAALRRAHPQRRPRGGPPQRPRRRARLDRVPRRRPRT